MKQNSLLIFWIGAVFKVCNKIVLGSIAPSQKEGRVIDIIISGKLCKQIQQHALISLILMKLLGKLLMFTVCILTAGSLRLKQKEMPLKH